MKTYDVRIDHHHDRSHVIVHARNADEAMDQAILTLDLTYHDVRFASCDQREDA